MAKKVFLSWNSSTTALKVPSTGGQNEFYNEMIMKKKGQIGEEEGVRWQSKKIQQLYGSYPTSSAILFSRLASL